MTPEVVHAGIFHHVERGGAKGQSLDHVQSQHHHGMGDRGNTRGKAVKGRIGQPQGFGGQDLILFDQGADFFRRDVRPTDHGGKLLNDMGQGRQLADLLDSSMEINFGRGTHD